MLEEQSERSLMWTGLLENLAVVALFILAVGNAQDWLLQRRRLTRHLIFALLMGGATVSSMLIRVEIEKGVFVDLRSSIITVSGFLAGPLVGLIVMLIAGSARVVMAGSGTAPGLFGIVMSGLVGVGAHALLRGRPPEWRNLPLAAVAAAVAPLLGMVLSPIPRDPAFIRDVLLPSVVMNFATALVASATLYQGRRASEQRNLLRSALSQAPDYLYVKDRRGQFVEANRTVVEHNGFTSVEQIRGLTDFDLVSEVRAKTLFAEEQRIVDSGQPLIDYSESLIDPDGRRRWYVTSKVPVRNSEGEIIGISGLTRDFTERHELEATLEASRNQLAYALREMSDGLAMFAPDGRLVLCNQQYKDSFPLTAHVREPGRHFREILEAVAATGEQMGIAPDSEYEWIDRTASTLGQDGEQEIKLYSGRWLRIRTRVTDDGSSMVVVSDVSTLKEAELALLAMTEQLKGLASTDGLTGLLNRRAFDQALESELARATRSDTRLCLLMIDVDFFKKYNDRYGHQAGDDCLKVVAKALQLGVRRSGDIVARYGGEEFVVILPDTSEDDAFGAAEALRKAVKDLGIAHPENVGGSVTVSIGVSACVAGELRGSAQLLGRADRALYQAKDAGRNRVMGWRAHYSIPQNVGR